MKRRGVQRGREGPRLCLSRWGLAPAKHEKRAFSEATPGTKIQADGVTCTLGEIVNMGAGPGLDRVATVIVLHTPALAAAVSRFSDEATSDQSAAQVHRGAGHVCSFSHQKGLLSKPILTQLPCMTVFRPGPWNTNQAKAARTTGSRSRAEANNSLPRMGLSHWAGGAATVPGLKLVHRGLMYERTHAIPPALMIPSERTNCVCIPDPAEWWTHGSASQQHSGGLWGGSQECLESLAWKGSDPLSIHDVTSSTLRVLRDLKHRSIFNKSWGLLRSTLMYKNAHQSGYSMVLLRLP
ncbi:unnamed protein product [Menidia menidia]|uniref:(Atlantic silverside) hypothetical protein n=1 Tax=Menidia menidia TaxID=238744 RepID=A0A8S4BZF4_9TELE|nr:unnamed protein product [Menidia menidia]